MTRKRAKAQNYISAQLILSHLAHTESMRPDWKTTCERFLDVASRRITLLVHNSTSTCSAGVQYQPEHNISS
ncbi:hypothetical protein M501DRAFT_13031 [Patellaria atrata CBS 101060]|uniref:Uncharacterized protein n=1 Tax=Patellaria atrata CBS 101060 TaxID=1346257 RepID=A0A9P4SGW0_9PEZI|nr:hypothetical protein M501DRAFT_13031 [Patellaria atrata CBS 101060]